MRYLIRKQRGPVFWMKLRQISRPLYRRAIRDLRTRVRKPFKRRGYTVVPSWNTTL